MDYKKKYLKYKNKYLQFKNSNQIGGNELLHQQNDVGGWSGDCTCPNGEVYKVGDNKDNCHVNYSLIHIIWYYFFFK